MDSAPPPRPEQDRRPAGSDPGRRPPALWRELVLGLVVLVGYVVVSQLDWPSRAATAAQHGRQIFDLERRLSLDVELSLNRDLARRGWLRVLANYEYATTYVLSAFILLFWLYARRPTLYPWARNTFVTLNVVGVACFAVYPVTPPRLLPQLGFADTVRQGHTVGSWGSPLVQHANQLAAMPSLHLAWALWVSAVLALVSGGWRSQLLSGVHVALTVLVILATGNHYVLDGVGAGILVWVSIGLTSLYGEKPPSDHHSPRHVFTRLGSRGARALRRVAPWSGGRGEPIPAADRFFLYAETPQCPQHVGGLVLLDHARAGLRPPTRDDLVEVLRAQLPHLVRLGQKLDLRAAWRRPRWQPAGPLDWNWHVLERDLSPAPGQYGGIAAVHALVAEIQSELLPRDRPLWRLIAVRGVSETQSAVIIVVHHVIADGFGTVAQAVRLLEPVIDLSAGLPDRPISLARRAGAVTVGLAQLATEPGPKRRLASGPASQHRFGTVVVPLEQVRDTARGQSVRVSDVLLSGVASAVGQVWPDAAGSPPAALRTSVPLMVRHPGLAAEGNVTAAVLIDLPLQALTSVHRLRTVAERSRRLHTGTRALASRFVMNTVAGVLPPVAHAWFARTVYGGRTFQAIVSNMPGPAIQLTLAGRPLAAAFPILPLAPDAPLAFGALGWNGQLCIGISADSTYFDDLDVFAAALRANLAELAALAEQAATGPVRGDPSRRLAEGEAVRTGPPAPGRTARAAD